MLRAVWSPLLEHAQNDVQMWTKGGAGRGRPVTDARAGLPKDEVWTAFLRGLLDFDGLTCRARRAELHMVTDEQAERIREAIGSQQDSILSCLGWATVFVARYQDRGNAELRDKYPFRGDKGKHSLQELRRRLLPQTWSAVKDGRLEPWTGAP